MALTRDMSQAWSNWLLRFILILTCARWSQALQMSYCSPDLVGATNELTSIYMSNGMCQNQCQASYAFAVIQGQDCWCSNNAPANAVSTSQCSDKCPGFPSDFCGNVLGGLYSYFNLGRQASGTIGGRPSSAAPSSSSSQPSSPSDQSTSTPLSTSIQTTAAPSTQVYTSVFTQTGRVSTIVVTQAPAATSDSALGGNATLNAKSSGLSGGAVAGIVIGIALALLLIGAILFWMMRRKHQRNIDEISNAGGHVSPSVASRANNTNNVAPSRQVSQLSSAGLLTRPNKALTSGAPSTMTDPRSAGGATHSSDRNSTHMTVDQRLNPWAIYSNEESRNSNVSLQDNHDYSRQLRVANPDA